MWVLFDAYFVTMIYGTCEAGQIALVAKQKPNPEFWIFCLLAAFAIIMSTVAQLGANRVHRDQLERQQFWNVYRNQLSKSMGILHDARSYKNEAQFKQVQKYLLEAVCKIVKEYTGSEDLLVNANLMIDISPGQPRFNAAKAQAKFYGESFWQDDKYICILQVFKWASEDHDLIDDLALPVHRLKKAALFGAPHAFCRGTEFTISDTHDNSMMNKLLANADYDVRERIIKYFNDSLTAISFVSRCLYNGDTKVGILNIQANKPKIFGNELADNKELMENLAPFLFALGVTLSSARDLINSASQE